MFVNPITGDRQYMYDIPEPDHDIASDVDTGPDLITYIALGPVVNTPITPGPGREISHHHMDPVVKSPITPVSGC